MLWSAGDKIYDFLQYLIKASSASAFINNFVITSLLFVHAQIFSVYTACLLGIEGEFRGKLYRQESCYWLGA